MVSRGVIDTVGSDPAVSLTPRDRILLCQGHRWIRFHCLMETMESFTKMSKPDPAVSLKPQDQKFSNDYFSIFSANTKLQYIRKALARESGP
jgi:hypothetical protein